MSVGVVGSQYDLVVTGTEPAVPHGLAGGHYSSATFLGHLPGCQIQQQLLCKLK